MQSVPERPRADRCRSCGSRVGPGDADCPICGATLGGWRALRRLIAESLIAALGLVVLLGLLFAVGAGKLSWPGRRAGIEVSSMLPTDVPTFTPAPPRTSLASPSTPRPPTVTPLPAVITHTVVSRDTLYGIAGRYGVTVAALVEANPELQENPHRLAIGQELRVPVAAGPPSPTARQVAEAQPSVAAEGPAAEGAATALAGDTVTSGLAVTAAMAVATHEVIAGQTITEVAEAYQMTVDELVAANPELKARPALLPSGAALIVRAPSALTATLGLSGSWRAGAVDQGGAVPGWLPPEDVGTAVYPAPRLLTPGNGAVVTSPTPILQWSSVGVLPAGVYYVVALRDADASDGRARLIWMASNATALRVPADVRPARGSRANIAWSVSVRRMGSGLFASDEGTRLSAGEPWRTFTWAP